MIINNIFTKIKSYDLLTSIDNIIALKKRKYIFFFRLIKFPIAVGATFLFFTLVGTYQIFQYLHNIAPPISLLFVILTIIFLSTHISQYNIFESYFNSLFRLSKSFRTVEFNAYNSEKHLSNLVQNNEFETSLIHFLDYLQTTNIKPLYINMDIVFPQMIDIHRNELISLYINKDYEKIQQYIIDNYPLWNYIATHIETITHKKEEKNQYLSKIYQPIQGTELELNFKNLL